jgi:hypothetical protein
MLVFVPVSAVAAWRWSNPNLNRAAFLLLLLSASGLVIWFGVLVANGTDLTETIHDRVMHAIGVIVGAINYPVVQAIAGALVLVSWPSSWTYRSRKSVELPQD